MTYSKEVQQGLVTLLVQGKIKGAAPGAYIEPGHEQSVPAYDIDRLIEALMPRWLTIEIEAEVDVQGQTSGYFAILHNGMGPNLKVSLGAAMPRDTEALLLALCAGGA